MYVNIGFFQYCTKMASNNISNTANVDVVFMRSSLKIKKDVDTAQDRIRVISGALAETRGQLQRQMRLMSEVLAKVRELEGDVAALHDVTGDLKDELLKIKKQNAKKVQETQT